MMRRHSIPLALALLSLAPAALQAQTEIPGTVTGVADRVVTIQIPGDMLPREGDEVRLRFRDPVEGAGLVFLDGVWVVSAVRRDEVEAAPRGETARPQGGLVALISSASPRSKTAFAEPDAPADPVPAVDEEPAVAAVVRDTDDAQVERIERRRWVAVTAGGGVVRFQSPAFQEFDADPEFRPRITASLGIFVLPTLSVGGYLGSVKVDGLATDGRALNAQEIYKVIGATLYFGTPGNVPGDVNPFIQGGHAWYDIHYGGGGDPDVTGTGFFGGVGAVVTIRRGFGLYVAGQVFTSTFDESFTVFDRVPAELNAGATVIIG